MACAGKGAGVSLTKLLRRWNGRPPAREGLIAICGTCIGALVSRPAPFHAAGQIKPPSCCLTPTVHVLHTSLTPLYMRSIARGVDGCPEELHRDTTH